MNRACWKAAYGAARAAAENRRAGDVDGKDSYDAAWDSIYWYYPMVNMWTRGAVASAAYECALTDRWYRVSRSGRRVTSLELELAIAAYRGQE